MTVNEKRRKDVQRLIRLLEQLDMANVDLARHAGVARSTVQRWLANDVAIPLSVLRMLELMLHLRRTPGMARVLWANPDEMLADDLKALPSSIEVQ